MKAIAAAATILILASTASLAQSPYAGMQTRPIKALSTQQVDDLRAGRGMGLALAAELNGYPGPSHVLELSEKLALSPAQKERIQKLFESKSGIHPDRRQTDRAGRRARPAIRQPLHHARRAEGRDGEDRRDSG